MIEKCDFALEKLQQFVEKNGYVPEMFNPYNCAEIISVAPTQTTNCDRTSSSATILIVEKEDGMRIRKLTPKECFRLMGFDDSDFEKAAKVNSDSQLYKQAGNSIVVDVLCNIFESMKKAALIEAREAQCL